MQTWLKSVFWHLIKIVNYCTQEHIVIIEQGAFPVKGFLTTDWYDKIAFQCKNNFPIW